MGIFLKRIIVLLFMVIFVFAGNTEANDMHVYRGHTYQLLDIDSTWFDADEYCQEQGGHLVIIETPGEQHFIANLVRVEGRRNNYWLGAYKDNNYFVWIDGSPVRYSNWAYGQPDNYRGIEDSVMLYRGRNPANPNEFATWNDIASDGNCNGETFFGIHNFGFICEWDYIID